MYLHPNEQKDFYAKSSQSVRNEGCKELVFIFGKLYSEVQFERCVERIFEHIVDSLQWVAWAM